MPDVMLRRTVQAITSYVSAQAQANAVRNLMPMLTETEEDYFRRGKNSNPHAESKNSSHVDYMYATGFEALIGFLFLDNQEERMEELILKSFEFTDDAEVKA